MQYHHPLSAWHAASSMYQQPASSKPRLYRSITRACSACFSAISLSVVASSLQRSMPLNGNHTWRLGFAHSLVCETRLEQAATICDSGLSTSLLAGSSMASGTLNLHEKSSYFDGFSTHYRRDFSCILQPLHFCCNLLETGG